ncbi:alpha/beta hydrolase [Klebsiella oxytoca]|uniref:alpha/beta hydrolase n=1 Tax=Klebsiella oxytoca TaxID=571 RepID=UPI0022484CAA|nr:alpha/beta hydrolase [Klebsiella oxytoca]MCW9445969.1 alpha/beta hydrolase [Klebsiella oxytoca]
MDIVYRGMTRPQLNLAYNNTMSVPDFSSYMKKIKMLSEFTYKKHNPILNVQYGNKKRNVFDYFPCGFKYSPTLIFIHGGYWQNCEKEDFAFIADGIIQENINVILAEYTLAPESTISEIVAEIRLLLDFLKENMHLLNMASDIVCLSGHSAGGHLTSVCREHSLVTHAMTLSALVDLEPIKLCWLNDKLNLTEEEIKLYSPVNSIKPGVPTGVYVGGGELSELIRQSEDYYFALVKNQENAFFNKIKKVNHFDLLFEFGVNDRTLTDHLLKLIKC